MKRSLLDITQKISRKRQRAILNCIDLTHPTYYIFEATGWKLVDMLREIEYRVEQDRLNIYINNLSIAAVDYVVEPGKTGLLIKFIKNKFGYPLDARDFIEIIGDIEKYA
jgi:hypothetical protein